MIINPDATTEAAVIAELAKDATTTTQHPQRIDGQGVPFVILPTGARESVEKFLLAPVRQRGTVIASSVASFIALVGRFCRPESIVYADIKNQSLTAVFDEANGTTPAWGAFRAVYKAQSSRQLNKWRGADKQKRSQVDFAEFIEDNLDDIASPTGAELLEMAQNFTAHRAVTFDSSLRLSDGTHKLAYRDENVPGDVRVPESITLGIPLFELGARYRLTARLRYRIETGGKLVLWTELARIEDAIESAFTEQVEDVETKLTLKSVEVVYGSPAAER